MEEEQRDGKKRVRLVLAHNPDTSYQLKQYRLDVIFSGFLKNHFYSISSQLIGKWKQKRHTHGGQICFPWGTPVLAFLQKLLELLPAFIRKKFFPRRYFVVRDWKLGKGLAKVEGDGEVNNFHYVYTSNGIATHPPMRLFCDREVAVIQIFQKL